MIGQSLEQTHRVDRIAARWGSGRMDKAVPVDCIDLTGENESAA